MGKGKCNEFENTFGATEGTLFEPEEREQLIDPDLVLELIKNKIKFTESDLLFVTKDKTGKIIFLETGNKTAGLEHIINGTDKSGKHKNQFNDKFNINHSEISTLIFDFIKKGKIILSKPTKENGKKIFLNLADKYICVVIADNGFIVTAYPTSKKKIGGL